MIAINRNPGNTHAAKKRTYSVKVYPEYPVPKDRKTKRFSFILALRGAHVPIVSIAGRI